MKFEIDKHEKYVHFKLEESALNADNFSKLKTELIILSNTGVRNIILDLSDVQAIDSSGLSALLIGNRVCTSAKGVFVLTGLNPHIDKMIQISQLNQVLQIFPTLEECIDLIFMEEIERELRGELE
jgi:anti-sigma B factor antagonist